MGGQRTLRADKFRDSRLSWSSCSTFRCVPSPNVGGHLGVLGFYLDCDGTSIRWYYSR